MERRLIRAFGSRLRSSRESASGLDDRLRVAAPISTVRDRRLLVANSERRLAAALHHRAEVLRERLAGTAAALSGLSPLAVLERGYAIARRHGDDRALRSAAEVEIGAEIEVRLSRGDLRARVESRRVIGDGDPEGERG
jgi:exodeoxyribonuclease VII large subunit